MEWIGTKLQRKRIEADYAFRESNEPRDKKQECVWNRPDLQELIKTHLVENHDYYRFCDQYLGSKSDLFAS